MPAGIKALIRKDFMQRGMFETIQWTHQAKDGGEELICTGAGM